MIWLTSKLGGNASGSGSGGDSKLNAALLILRERLMDNISDKGNWKHCLEQLKVICANHNATLNAEWMERINAVLLGTQYFPDAATEGAKADDQDAGTQTTGKDTGIKSQPETAEFDPDLVKLALELLSQILRESGGGSSGTASAVSGGGGSMSNAPGTVDGGSTPVSNGVEAKQSASGQDSTGAMVTPLQLSVLRYFLERHVESTPAKASDKTPASGPPVSGSRTAAGGLGGLVNVLQQPKCAPHRFRVLRIFERMHVLRGDRFRDTLLDTPLGAAALVELLGDSQDVVRASAIGLFRELVPLAGPQLLQAIAFNGAFEKLFNIIREESFTGSTVDDCLRIVLGLIGAPAARVLLLDLRRELVQLLELVSARQMWTETYSALSRSRQELVQRRIKDFERYASRGTTATSENLPLGPNPSLATLGLILAITGKLAESCLSVNQAPTGSNSSSGAHLAAPSHIQSNAQTQTLLAPLVAPLALIALSEPPSARLLHAYSVTQFVDAVAATGGTAETVVDASKPELIQYQSESLMSMKASSETHSLSSMTIASSGAPPSQVLISGRFPHTLYPIPMEYRLQALVILSYICFRHYSNQSILCNLDLPSLVPTTPLGPHTMGLVPMPMAGIVPCLDCTSSLFPTITARYRVAPHQSHGENAPDMLLVPAPLALALRALDSGSVLESDVCRTLFAVAVARNAPIQAAIAECLGAPALTLAQTLHQEIQTALGQTSTGRKSGSVPQALSALVNLPGGGAALDLLVSELDVIAQTQMPRLIDRNAVLGTLLTQTLSGSANPSPIRLTDPLSSAVPSAQTVRTLTSAGNAPTSDQLSDLRRDFAGDSDSTPHPCMGGADTVLAYNHKVPEAYAEKDVFLVSCVRMSRAAALLESIIDDSPLVKLALLLEPVREGSQLNPLETTTIAQGGSFATSLLRLFVSHAAFWRHNAAYLAQVRTFGDSTVGSDTYANELEHVKALEVQDPALVHLMTTGLHASALIGSYAIPQAALTFAATPSLHSFVYRTIADSANSAPPSRPFPGTVGQIAIEIGLTTLLSLILSWTTECAHFVDALLLFPGVSDTLVALLGAGAEQPQSGDSVPRTSIVLPYVRAGAAAVIASCATVYATKTDVAPDLLSESQPSTAASSEVGSATKAQSLVSPFIQESQKLSKQLQLAEVETSLRAEKEDFDKLVNPFATTTTAGSSARLDHSAALESQLGIHIPSWSTATLPSAAGANPWLATLPKARHSFAFPPSLLFSILALPGTLTALRNVLKAFDESTYGLNASLGYLPARLSPAQGSGVSSAVFSFTCAPDPELAPVHVRAANAHGMLARAHTSCAYITFSPLDQGSAAFIEALERALRISEQDPVFFTALHASATPQMALSYTSSATTGFIGRGASERSAASVIKSPLTRNLAAAYALTTPMRQILLSRSLLTSLGTVNLLARLSRASSALDRSALVLFATNASAEARPQQIPGLLAAGQDSEALRQAQTECAALKQRIHELESKLLLDRAQVPHLAPATQIANQNASTYLKRIAELEQELENVRVTASEQLLAERVKNRTEFLEMSLTALEKDRAALIDKLHAKDQELDALHSACATLRARVLELESELQLAQSAAAMAQAERDDLLESGVTEVGGISQVDLAYQELAAKYETLAQEHEELLIVLAMTDTSDLEKKLSENADIDRTQTDAQNVETVAEGDLQNQNKLDAQEAVYSEAIAKSLTKASVTAPGDAQQCATIETQPTEQTTCEATKRMVQDEVQERTKYEPPVAVETRIESSAEEMAPEDSAEVKAQLAPTSYFGDSALSLTALAEQTAAADAEMMALADVEGESLFAHGTHLQYQFPTEAPHPAASTGHANQASPVIHHSNYQGPMQTPQSELVTQQHAQSQEQQNIDFNDPLADMVLSDNDFNPGVNQLLAALAQHEQEDDLNLR